MTLPTLPLPFPVPEIIPVLLHPIVVHFAVVLPLIILILELVNLITKRKSLTITIYILFFILAGVFLGAYGTGVIDGKNGGLLMSDEGLEHLKAHKQIGIYLLYLSTLPILLKLLTLAVKKPWAKIIYMLSFVGIIALTLYQAKEGGELVYEYGLNVEAKVALDDTVEELQDEMDELKEGYEEQIQTLQSKLEAANSSSIATPVEAVTPEPETSVEAPAPSVEAPAHDMTPTPEIVDHTESNTTHTSAVADEEVVAPHTTTHEDTTPATHH